MADLINASLFILGAAALVSGITTYKREKGTERILRLCLLMLGICTALWCWGYGFMGMSDNESSAIKSKMIGTTGINLYILGICIAVMHTSEISRSLKKCFTFIIAAFGIADWFLMRTAEGYTFVIQDGRMCFYTENNFNHTFHTIFMITSYTIILVIEILSMSKIGSGKYRQILTAFVAGQLPLIISGIPDTILPLYNYPSFPSSCYGAFISYMTFRYFCIKYNILSISVVNVSDYIFQSGNEKILVFDTEQRLFMANSSASAFLSDSTKKGASLDSLFIISKEDSEKLFNDILAEKVSKIDLQTINSGAVCTLRATVAKDKSSNPFCIIFFIYDLTKELGMLDELRKANNAKNEFLSNMSHEMRTPLNAVIGMNEMILSEAENDDILDYAETAKESAEVLLSLINDILDISAIESGKLESVSTAYELSSMIDDSYEMIMLPARKKGLNVRIHADDDLPTFLYGDEAHIRQILSNILSNAVKYTDSGTIDFSISGEKKDDDTIIMKFIISDTGIGIQNEYLDTIFNRFERKDLKIVRTSEGAGLGLNISKNLAELMGGSIEVESVYGEGSTFTVSIPQKKADHRPKAAEIITEEQEHEKFTAPSARILVVDDVETNIKILSCLLKKTEIVIDYALSGNDALEMCSHTKYDIIFMDHMMPDMDGIETYTRIKESDCINRSTPTIMLTANALPQMMEIYYRSGFSDYLTKPIDVLKLEKSLLIHLPHEKIVLEKEQAKETVKEDASSVLDYLKKLIPEIDITKGIRNCGENEDFYIEILNDYVNNPQLKNLNEYYEQKDWKKYTVSVHSLKTLSRTIGLNELGDINENLQKASEENRIDYIDNNHFVMTQKLESALKCLRTALKA